MEDVGERERERGMKRSRERAGLEDSGSRTYKRQECDAVPQVAFLVTAGAGGKMTGEGPTDGAVVNERTSLRALLLRACPGAVVVGPVRSENGKRLVGGGGPTYKVVCAHRKALADLAKDVPSTPIILVGQSFGSRVSCYSVTSRFAKREKDLSSTVLKLSKYPIKAKDKRTDCMPLPAANIKGLILFGFPGFHRVQKRTQIIETLAQETSLEALFISGSKDEENVNVVRRCIEEISLPRLQFYQVDKGEHNPMTGANDFGMKSLESKIQVFVKKALSA